MTDTKDTKLPWINPDLTFKGAVIAALALLAVLGVVIVGLLLIGLGLWFVWEFAVELISTTYGRALIGLTIIALIVAAVRR